MRLPAACGKLGWGLRPIGPREYFRQEEAACVVRGAAHAQSPAARPLRATMPLGRNWMKRMMKRIM